MKRINIESKETIGYQFITGSFLPAGQDEYYLRNQQISKPAGYWRQLVAVEIAALEKNGNSADNWDNIRVSGDFDTQQIRNNVFAGLVRIGRVRNMTLEHHDMRLPIGITNSRIVSCDIGDDAAIHNVLYLAHYIIGDRCILFNIGEMHTTDHAKWGNGVLKEGEPEDVRVWLYPMNEAGGRRILPFDGMNTSDAYLWSKYRDNLPLQRRLEEMTKQVIDGKRGYYSLVGNDTVIKSSRILKDVKIGSNCYIKGANKLKNLTINSSAEESTQIGEGVEIVNGIIGFGCNVFYGCKAVRFILGNNSSLKYGARLIHSVLGDNSTISCCEVLNNLIFPSHEQHHNNSFLIASVVMGQSNMAAGATIGSNHNSRSNDSEIQAGRGFWPGLCTSVKHSCRFASYTLLAKSDYQYELDIPLPFSLINNNLSKDELEVMPAYWWMYNMYALARNNWKFKNRDKRKVIRQHIEYNALAPDSVDEIKSARQKLELWTAKAKLREEGTDVFSMTKAELLTRGHQLLNGDEKNTAELEVLGEKMEKSRRKVRILKPYQAYHAYGEMLVYYVIKTLMRYLEKHPEQKLSDMCNNLRDTESRQWVNLGGQLVTQRDLDTLCEDIVSEKLASWPAVHQRYDILKQQYREQKQRHAFATMCCFLGTPEPSLEQWQWMLDKTIRIQQYFNEEVYASRKKDDENSFRKITYLNEEEMKETIGTAEENGFVKQVNEETEVVLATIRSLKERG